MTLRSAAITLFLVALALSGAMAARQRLTTAAANSSDGLTPPSALGTSAESSTPVLVELFTSEGCSSCPPADALLSRLGRTQPVPGADIIILEEHVDYWDRLGWKDPFSSEAATARQTAYGAAFGGEQIYTPQMIVDGRAGFVGSSDSDALRSIRAAIKAPKPEIHLSWEINDALSIRVDPLNNLNDAARGDSPQLVLVLAENMLHSDVKRGENAGRGLEHNGVVRQWSPVAKLTDASAGFSTTVSAHAEHEWNRNNLMAVVFVQESRSRHILAAQAIAFPR